MLKLKKNTAFTLLEVILYVGISSLVLIFIMGITWDILKNQKQTLVATELIESGELVIQKIANDVHEADDLNEGFCIFNDDPGTLSLQNGVNEIIIEDDYEQITVNGEEVTIRKLIRTEDGNSVDLTNNNVNVTSFIIENLSRDENSQNVNISIELEYIGTASESLGVQPVQFERSMSIRNK